MSHRGLLRETISCQTSLPTPHWNDDLNKIIEPDISMVNLSKQAIWACKITIFKIRSPGLFKWRENSNVTVLFTL